MRSRSLPPARLPAFVFGAAVLAATGLPAFGQWPGPQGRPPGFCPAPPGMVYPQFPGSYAPLPPAPPGMAYPQFPGSYAPLLPAPPGMAYPQVPGSYPAAPSAIPAMPRAGQQPATPPAAGQQPATPPATGQQPTTPQTPGTTPTPGAEGTTPTEPTAQEPSASPEQGAATAPAAANVAAGNTVKGDQLGVPGLGFLPGQPKHIVAAVPSVRSFKIAEDESPVPLDRVYVDFNFFDNINRSVNERLGSPVHNIEAYRETFGVEKTFLDGDASLGLRLPLNTLTSESTTPGLGGTSTDIGDLAIISKLVFCRDQQTGSLLSGGLALTTPTGPSHFAGSDTFLPIHTWLLTPYVGYRWNEESWYVQGFLSLDVPTGNDVTLLHNDIQIGYYLLRNKDEDAILTGITPQFEVHVNDPLDHRGALNLSDPLGTPDWIDLTAAVTFEMCHTSTLALGFVTPVTGPKPYDFEVLAQFNWRFGRTARAAAGGPGTVVGE